MNTIELLTAIGIALACVGWVVIAFIYYYQNQEK